MLVDQKYGARLLAEAKALGIVTCAPVEKSGQSEFDFEYGEDFGRHVEEAAPTFTKALVRYNPEGDATANEKQRRRLATLSDYSHSNGYKFMFELLVPATDSQAEAVAQDSRAYDLKLRPELTTRTMAELQDAGGEARDRTVDTNEATGSLAYTRNRAREAADAATAGLERLPDSRYKIALVELAEFAVERRS